jgi:predicted nucleic-acid-binding protein
VRAIDSHVLVRLIARDDAAQAAAAESFVAGGAWVSHLALVETVWVLDAVYGLDAGRLARGVRMLLDHSKLAIEAPHVVDAAVAHFEARPALGFSDCMMLEVARAAGHQPLGTFDRKLAKLPGAERIG